MSPDPGRSEYESQIDYDLSHHDCVVLNTNGGSEETYQMGFEVHLGQAPISLSSFAGRASASNLEIVTQNKTTWPYPIFTPRLTVTHSGNVGIGTTSPYGMLTVAGGASPTMQTTTDFLYGTTGSAIASYMGASTGNTYGVIQASTTGATANGNLILNASGGNVGIATSAPQGKLQVSDAVNSASGSLMLQTPYASPGDYQQITWADNTNTAVSAMQGVALSGGEMAFNFILQNGGSHGISNGNTVMTLLGNGNVGIGTTAPGYKLSVNGALGSQTSDFVSGTVGSEGYIGMGATTGNTYLAIDSYINGANAFGNIVLHPSGNGNVGIGTTSPQDALDVDSGAIRWGTTAQPTNYYARAIFTPMGYGDPNQTNLQFQVQSWPNGAATVPLTLTGAGNVGIGTTTPQDILHVKGALNGNVDIRVENTSNGGAATAGIHLISDDGTIGVLWKNSSTDTTYGGPDSVNIGTASTGAIAFTPNNDSVTTPAMYISNAGNVGIGSKSHVYISRVS